jgi:hypothetical protein
VAKIDGTSFGSITIDGKHYPYDIWIFADGSIRRRDRDHEFTLDEFDLLLEGNPEVVVAEQAPSLKQKNPCNSWG